MMDDLTRARTLLSRPIPAALAARLFDVKPSAFASIPPDRLTLAVAFDLLRRDVEGRLRVIRAAHRSRLMKARRAAEAVVATVVTRAAVSAALAALGAEVGLILHDLAAKLALLDPHAAARALAARQAVKAAVEDQVARVRQGRRRAAR